jgi:hypothetical protein
MALVAYALVRSADLAISAAISRSVIRAVCYGVVAVFLLLIVVTALFGI